jgi:hypothetical protein
MNKQESTIPMRSGMSDIAGGFQTDLSATTKHHCLYFSSDKALGALSEGMNDQIDFDAPPERMVLEGQNRSGEGNLITFKDSTYPPIPSFLFIDI